MRDRSGLSSPSSRLLSDFYRRVGAGTVSLFRPGKVRDEVQEPKRRDLDRAEKSVRLCAELEACQHSLTTRLRLRARESERYDGVDGGPTAGSPKAEELLEFSLDSHPVLFNYPRVTLPVSRLLAGN